MLSLLTLAFYFSGVFVILTPLPLLYAFLRDPKRAPLVSLAPAFFFVVIFYFLGIGPLSRFYASHPGWEWLFLAPGMNFLSRADNLWVTLFGISYFVYFIFVAHVLGRFFLDKQKSFASILLSSLMILGIGVSLYLTILFVRHEAPLGYLQNYFLQVMKEFIAVQKNAGIPPEQVDFLQRNLDSFVHYFTMIVPSLFFVSILLTFVVNLVLGAKIVVPLVKTLGVFSYNQWKLPFIGVWIVIAMVSLEFLNLYVLNNQNIVFVIANILVVMVFIYYLQGLAISSFFLEKKGVRPLTRIAIYSLMVLFFQTLGIVLVGVGFFDSWVDFRKMTLEKNIVKK